MNATELPPVSLEGPPGQPVLRLVGSLNLSVAAELYAVAMQALDAGGPVVVECGAAEYLDVSSLQILVALQGAVAAEDRSFTIASAPSWLSPHLHLVGLGTLAEAIVPDTH